MALSTYRWFQTWLSRRFETADAHLLEAGLCESSDTPEDCLLPEYTSPSSESCKVPAPSEVDGTEPQTGDKAGDQMMSSPRPDDNYFATTAAALRGLIDATQQGSEPHKVAARTVKAIVKAMSLSISPSYGAVVAATSTIENCAKLRYAIYYQRPRPFASRAEQRQAFDDVLDAASRAGLAADARMIAMKGTCTWPVPSIPHGVPAPEPLQPPDDRSGYQGCNRQIGTALDDYYEE